MNYNKYIYIKKSQIYKFFLFIVNAIVFLFLSFSPVNIGFAQSDTAQIQSFYFAGPGELWANVYAVSPGVIYYQSCSLQACPLADFDSSLTGPGPYNGTYGQYMGITTPNTLYRITVRPSSSSNWTWSAGCLTNADNTGCAAVWLGDGQIYPVWGPYGDGQCLPGELESGMGSTDCGFTCGNGFREQPDEECDPPNGVTCSAECKIMSELPTSIPLSPTPIIATPIISSPQPGWTPPPPPPITFTPVPTPTLNPTPPPIGECQLTPTGGNVRIRAESSTESEILDMIRMGAIADIESETTDASGTIWFRVTLNSVTGWVSSTVVIFNNNCGVTPPVNIAELLTVLDCEELVADVETLPVYLQQSVAIHNLDENVCESFTEIINPPTRPIPLIDIMTNLKYIQDQCPNEVVNFLDTLETLKKLSENTSGQDTLTLLRNINAALTEDNACKIAETINNGQIPSDLPESVLQPIAIVICVGGITPQRYEENLGNFEKIGVTKDDLIATNSCNLVKSLTQIGKFDDEQIALFDWIMECPAGYTTETALNLLKFAIVTGADSFTFWTEEERNCSHIYEIISKHQREKVAEVPEEFMLCNAAIVQLFLKTNTLTEVEFQLFLDSHNPCIAIVQYINMGKLAELEVPPVMPTPLPPIKPSIPTPLPPVPSPPWNGIMGNVKPINLNPTSIPSFADTSNDPPSVAIFIDLLIPPTYNEQYDKAVGVVVYYNQVDDYSALALIMDGEIEILDETKTQGKIRSPILYKDGEGNLYIAYLLVNLDKVELFITKPNEIPKSLIPQDPQYIFDESSRISWSSSGSAIIATLIDPEGHSGLYEINTDVFALKAVVSDARNPSISPDGSFVVYEHGSKEGGRQIYISVLPIWFEDNISLNPPNESDCFTPIFDTNSENLFMTCSHGDQNQFYVIKDLLSPTPIVSKLSVDFSYFIPGPVEGLIAYESNSSIFGVKYINLTATIDDNPFSLVSSSGNVSQISWRLD